MLNQDETLEKLLSIVTRQQQAIKYVTEVLAHVHGSVYAENRAGAPAKMELDELTSGDFSVRLPMDIDDLREQRGLTKYFDHGRG